MPNIELLRTSTVNIRPPRTGRRGTCGAESTVVLVLGKGAIGTVYHISYKFDVVRYMTKRQIELAQDEN
jgi:hypothetical protein